jgi:hypothetical protein
VAAGTSSMPWNHECARPVANAGVLVSCWSPSAPYQSSTRGVPESSNSALISEAKTIRVASWW